jgi:hypothetical protein
VKRDIHAEPVDEVDRAGITACRDMAALQPARQFILIVRRLLQEDCDVTVHPDPNESKG